MTITKLAVEPQLVGRTDVTCTGCAWSLPSRVHDDTEVGRRVRIAAALLAVHDVDVHITRSGHTVVVEVADFALDLTHQYRCSPPRPTASGTPSERGEGTAR